MTGSCGSVGMHGGPRPRDIASITSRFIHDTLINFNEQASAKFVHLLDVHTSLKDVFAILLLGQITI